MSAVNQGVVQTLMQINEQFFGAPDEKAPRSRYLRRLQAARSLLLSKNLDARSPVFITATDTDDEDLSGMTKIGQTFEVTGNYAAIRMAERTHRLATAAEIDKFRADQKRRETFCAEEEARKPENLGKALIQKLNITAQAIPAGPTPTTAKGTEK